MSKLYLLLFILVISSCKSPSKLLEEGNYKSAFNKAVAEVKRGKNMKENISVIKTSTQLKVEEALQYSAVMSQTEKVSNWIKTQTKMYSLLEDIGKANMILNGHLDESYDSLCDEKKDLDYQIVDYFYEEGHYDLDGFYNHGNKADARLAYEQFKKCEKYEGDLFFPLLQENISDAYENGVVYYVSNYGRIGKGLFLKPLPKDANFKPDCDIIVDHGFVSFSTSESSSDETFTKEIESGTEEVTDTSGHTTYTTLYETISATVTTKTIEVTASVETYLSVKNVTGQCSIGSSSFTTSTSNSYKEISVDGNEDALSHHVFEENGEPPFFKSNLESELMERADNNIGI